MGVALPRIPGVMATAATGWAASTAAVLSRDSGGRGHRATCLRGPVPLAVAGCPQLRRQQSSQGVSLGSLPLFPFSKDASMISS